jgi:hypothetical protein
LFSRAAAAQDGFFMNETEPGVRALFNTAPADKLLIAPLKSSAVKPLGFFMVTRTRDQENFRNANMILLSTVASVTAAALLDARRHEEEVHHARLQQGKMGGISW